MSTQIGVAFQLESEDITYDPIRGIERRQVYIGTKEACASIAASFILAGQRAETTESDGVNRVSVFIGNANDGQLEQPVDSWKIQKDFAQQSVWGHPKVWALATQLQAASPSQYSSVDDALGDTRGICESYLEGKVWDPISDTWMDNGRTGPIKPASTYINAIMLPIYKAMLRGVENMEVERCILRRVRSYSALYANRMVLDAIPKVYTTATLLSTFAIPPLIAAQLPLAPGASNTPTDTTWAWKLRSNEQDTDWKGKVIEQQEFQFAAWENILFDVL